MEFRRTPYDVAGAQNAILEAGLPSLLAPASPRASERDRLPRPRRRLPARPARARGDAALPGERVRQPVQPARVGRGAPAEALERAREQVAALIGVPSPTT